MTDDTFLDFLGNDTWCVIGHSSVALVEAAMADVPVISLGHSATRSLYKTAVSDIESISPVDNIIKNSWLNHLSYSQFYKHELSSGVAWKLFSESIGIGSRT
jgi:hypothetical protein